MDYVKRKPNISVTVVRPDYTSALYRKDTIVTFVPRPVSDEARAKPKEAESDALLSYSYVESLYDNESPFSISVTPEVDTHGFTWVDKIKLMDLVYIEEFGKVRYCGIVNDVRYSARMGQDGPARRINISGNGFGYLIESFKIVMDYHLWIGGPTAQKATDDLIRELESTAGKKLKPALRIIYDNFIKLATVFDSGNVDCGVKTLIEHFVDLDSDFSDKLECWYDMAIGFYKTGENDIWGIWRSVIPPPIYELWGRWEPNANQKMVKYKVFARQAPFDAEDWAALPSVLIHPLVLTDYDVGFSNSEVKTFFYGEMPGSELSREETLVIDNYKDTRVIDSEKWKKYGYRAMEIYFRYFKRGAEENKTAKVLEKAAKTMYSWYRKNDEFLSGTISLISIDDSSIMRYPKVGEKAQFLGGEFYIEEIERSWSYGDSPRSRLTVTRGYMYKADGSGAGPIENLGKRLLEFESIRHKNKEN